MPSNDTAPAILVVLITILLPPVGVLVTAARVLFPHRPETVDEVMPTPRKRARQGLSLESFTANEGGHAEIQIFTDSKDKIPEIDASTENPFYSTKAAGTRKKTPKKDLDHNKEVQEALERDEGMVYVL